MFSNQSHYEPLVQGHLVGRHPAFDVAAAAVAVGRLREEQPAARLHGMRGARVPRPGRLAVHGESLADAARPHRHPVGECHAVVVERHLDFDVPVLVVVEDRLAEVSQARPQVVVERGLVSGERLLQEDEGLQHGGFPCGVVSGECGEPPQIHREVYLRLEILEAHLGQHGFFSLFSSGMGRVVRGFVAAPARLPRCAGFVWPCRGGFAASSAGDLLGARAAGHGAIFTGYASRAGGCEKPDLRFSLESTRQRGSRE